MLNYIKYGISYFWGTLIQHLNIHIQHLSIIIVLGYIEFYYICPPMINIINTTKHLNIILLRQIIAGYRVTTKMYMIFM